MSLISSSISDTSEEDSSYSRSLPPASNPNPNPNPNPLLSMYRRELTDRRDEISQLRQKLGGVREENERLERALDMRRLNSYELDCDLQEALEKLESRDTERVNERKLHTDREEYFFTDPFSYLDKYEVQHRPPGRGDRTKRDPPTSSHPTRAAEMELSKPLTYQKKSELGGHWITHVPSHTSYDGLFQPQRTKGKQVTLPRKEDLIGKKYAGGKYVLSHQEASLDGSHLVTTLYKGNVNPTRSGGAQIRFTNTEVLHQCRDDLALTQGVSTQRYRIDPLNGLRMATIEDAKKNPDPNPFQPHPWEIARAAERERSNTKFRMATLDDAKLTPKHNIPRLDNVRRATIEDAMLPSKSRYIYLV